MFNNIIKNFEKNLKSRRLSGKALNIRKNTWALLPNTAKHWLMFNQRCRVDFSSLLAANWDTIVFSLEWLFQPLLNSFFWFLSGVVFFSSFALFQHWTCIISRFKLNAARNWEDKIVTSLFFGFYFLAIVHLILFFMFFASAFESSNWIS